MYPANILPQNTFPQLHELPNTPKQLWFRGTLPPQENKILSVVGSRDYTNYGKQCVQSLIGGLRGYPITIVSGLALGIDALAHEAALDARLHTIAIPGSGLNDAVLYPRTNRGLAMRILNQTGMLLSEFDPDTKSEPWMFPSRNRIIAGIAHAVLIVEAEERSGTLITARLACEYNRDLLAVPGNIFSKNSKGIHQFIKLGATPITCPDDIINALNIKVTNKHNVCDIGGYGEDSPEATVLTALREPISRDRMVRTLMEKHNLNTSTANIVLMRLELSGIIVLDQELLRIS